MKKKKRIPELVVINGKGGTGKTSVTAALVHLVSNPVMADCDVDAADLHLVLEPEIVERHDFVSGHEAVVRTDECINCGVCQDYCRFGAIRPAGNESYQVDPVSCEGCGVCVHFCPEGAIDFPDRHCGEWYLSKTSVGPMVHARLGVVAENSGKLVSQVRQKSREVAEEQNASVIIVDGPPGVGCPVIASITGASMVLVVTEPTCSGEHDLLRTLQLAKHFETPAMVCVNKWDINPEVTQRIEKVATEAGATVIGRIPYDKAVTKAQIMGKAVTEAIPQSEAAKAINLIGDKVFDILLKV